MEAAEGERSKDNGTDLTGKERERGHMRLS